MIDRHGDGGPLCQNTQAAQLGRRHNLVGHKDETLSGIVYTYSMLTYSTLQDRPREFLAATSLTHEEFARVLPAFATASAVLYPPDKTWEGKGRHRQSGGGAQGGLPQMADNLLFILVYPTTHPLQTMHGLQFERSQPQTNYWIQRLLPVLQRALAALGMAPERDASRVAPSPLALEGAPDVAIDGTERRRPRPTNAAQQQEQYSGKKKTHTDKNLLLVNEHTTKVVSLGPTVAGKKHDKKAADEGEIASPTNATLDKDTGFQGDAPPGGLTRQPKKTQRPGVERSRQVPQSPPLQCTRGRRKRHCRSETVPDGPRCLPLDHGGHLGSRHGDCVRLAQSSRQLSAPLPHIRCAELG
jgi:hypothetical protein